MTSLSNSKESTATMIARLVAVDDEGDERLLGEYTFHHTRRIPGASRLEVSLKKPAGDLRSAALGGGAKGWRQGVAEQVFSVRPDFDAPRNPGNAVDGAELYERERCCRGLETLSTPW
jgi:hypothetical protein